MSGDEGISDWRMTAMRRASVWHETQRKEGFAQGRRTNDGKLQCYISREGCGPSLAIMRVSCKIEWYAFSGLGTVPRETTVLLFASLLHAGLTLIPYLLMNEFIEQSRWQS